jgi:hypothetical protein
MADWVRTAVRVKFLLVALTMEGKFAGEGLQSMDKDGDMLSTVIRKLSSGESDATDQH